MKYVILVTLALFAALSQATPEPVPFESLTLKQLTGLRVPKNWKAMAPFKSGKKFVVQAAELPESYDASELVPSDTLPPVNLQVNGDCWAQGTTGVVELLAAIMETGLKDRQSVQHVIDCSGDGTAQNGGYFAYNLYKRFGTVKSADYPYTGRDQRCKQAGKTPQYRVKAWGYVGGQNRRPTVTEIKQALVEHSVVGVTITANRALMNFSNTKEKAVFKGCSNGQTNHIVILTGYDDALKAFHMRNSWGKSHGHNGYAYIPYGCSRVGELTTWVDIERI